ncbi:hypothetical protein HAX54_024476 [Datura stramonium]|uniref:O-fucosyltransferase family protein n=1 Tax=Datura stramonium TaxID=4076 RepID=A0ABS8UY20_DATST|nr:hypothetical protein [Datura stramonium]
MARRMWIEVTNCGDPSQISEGLRSTKRKTRIYVAGEETALEATQAMQHSAATIDYIVSLSSDVFINSHGGNMGRALEGHRAYVGHRKYIKPNKRMMLPFFEDSSVPERIQRIMKIA